MISKLWLIFPLLMWIIAALCIYYCLTLPLTNRLLINCQNKTWRDAMCLRSSRRQELSKNFSRTLINRPNEFADTALQWKSVAFTCDSKVKLSPYGTFSVVNTVIRPAMTLQSVWCLDDKATVNVTDMHALVGSSFHFRLQACHYLPLSMSSQHEPNLGLHGLDTDVTISKPDLRVLSVSHSITQAFTFTRKPAITCYWQCHISTNSELPALETDESVSKTDIPVLSNLHNVSSFHFISNSMDYLLFFYYFHNWVY